MLRIRTVNDVEDFVGAPGDPAGYDAQIKEMWESGESRPEWCFVAESEGEPIGRLGLTVTPTVTDPRWLGSLPPKELFAFGLHLPWEREDHLGLGRELITEAVGSLPAGLPSMLEVRINVSIHPFPRERRELMEACGMDLFQEKLGFYWMDESGGPGTSDRLEFRSIEETGHAEFRSVMAPCGEGTLDRNDRYYWEGCGPENWASQMMEYFDEEDASTWLIGYQDDEPVGYVAISAVEDWGSTIAHIGVTPQQRGNGYVDDLLLGGLAATRRAGISRMLSDVDVLNVPMRNAMTRVGMVEDPDRWDLWVYRAQVDDLN